MLENNKRYKFRGTFITIYHNRKSRKKEEYACVIREIYEVSKNIYFRQHVNIILSKEAHNKLIKLKKYTIITFTAEIYPYSKLSYYKSFRKTQRGLKSMKKIEIVKLPEPKKKVAKKVEQEKILTPFDFPFRVVC